MADNLERIFKDRLFDTRKSPDRDWSRIAERAGGELYEEVTSMFQYPEVALCALIQCLSELAMCQQDRYKRSRLIDRIRDAVKDRVEEMERIEAEDARTGYGQYEESEQEEEPKDIRRPPTRPKPAPPQAGPKPAPSQTRPRPTPRPTPPMAGPEDESAYPEEDYEDNQPDPPSPEPDEDDQDGDMDPDQSPWVHPNPAKEAGFKPPQGGR